MRLIDADALIESICWDECERKHEDCDYTCSSIAPIVNAPTVGGWISVKDAMPKTGYVYLITLNSPATMPKTMEAYLRHDGTWWRGSVSLMSEYVTHWMPLPEPPEEEEDETD